ECFFVAVHTVDREPIRLSKSDNGGVRRKPGVGGHQMLGVLLANALGNLRDRPLILFAWWKISRPYPDQIAQVLKPLSYESPISAKIRFAARLHLSEPALIAAIVSEIGREQPNDDASVICLPDHVVGKIEICRIGCGEVARLLERKDFGASGRRI